MQTPNKEERRYGKWETGNPPWSWRGEAKVLLKPQCSFFLNSTLAYFNHLWPYYISEKTTVIMGKMVQLFVLSNPNPGNYVLSWSVLVNVS